MKNKAEYFTLAFIGAVIFLVSIYMEVISINFERYSIIEYIIHDLKRWEWWKIVCIPFLTGTTYICAACFGWLKKLNNKNTLTLFAVCLIISLCFSVVNNLGYFSSISIMICLIFITWKVIKARDK